MKYIMTTDVDYVDYRFLKGSLVDVNPKHIEGTAVKVNKGVSVPWSSFGRIIIIHNSWAPEAVPYYGEFFDEL